MTPIRNCMPNCMSLSFIRSLFYSETLPKEKESRNHLPLRALHGRQCNDSDSISLTPPSVTTNGSSVSLPRTQKPHLGVCRFITIPVPSSTPYHISPTTTGFYDDLTRPDSTQSASPRRNAMSIERKAVTIGQETFAIPRGPMPAPPEKSATRPRVKPLRIVTANIQPVLDQCAPPEEAKSAKSHRRQFSQGSALSGVLKNGKHAASRRKESVSSIALDSAYGGSLASPGSLHSKPSAEGFRSMRSYFQKQVEPTLLEVDSDSMHDYAPTSTSSCSRDSLPSESFRQSEMPQYPAPVFNWNRSSTFSYTQTFSDSESSFSSLSRRDSAEIDPIRPLPQEIPATPVEMPSIPARRACITQDLTSISQKLAALSISDLESLLEEAIKDFAPPSNENTSFRHLA